LSIVNTVGEAGRSGLSSTLTVKYTHCGNLNNVNTSGRHIAGNRRPLASDLNTRDKDLLGEPLKNTLTSLVSEYATDVVVNML